MLCSGEAGGGRQDGWDFDPATMRPRKPQEEAVNGPNEEGPPPSNDIEPMQRQLSVEDTALVTGGHRRSVVDPDGEEVAVSRPEPRSLSLSRIIIPLLQQVRQFIYSAFQRGVKGPQEMTSVSAKTPDYSPWFFARN